MKNSTTTKKEEVAIERVDNVVAFEWTQYLKKKKKKLIYSP